MKNVLKLGAVVLAIVMVLSMSTVAFATTTDGITSDGITGAVNTSAGNTVTIVKELKVSNDQGSAIYLPPVSYSYSIAPASVDNLTVTDADGDVGLVYAGVTTDSKPTITSSITFGPNVTTDFVDANGTPLETQPTFPAAAATEGASYYRGITVDFTGVNFTHSGIYRYAITESSTSLTSAGVEHQNATSYSPTRYLDVYVQMVDSNQPADGIKDTAQIYGFVCFSANQSINGTESNGNLSTISKTNGYTGETGGDKYDTFDLTVTKTITGNLAETGHDFPFEVTLTNNSTNDVVLGAYINAADSTGTWDSTASGITTEGTKQYATLAATNVLKAGLSNGESIVLKGIPVAAAETVVVKETNNTYDVYTASASDGSAAINVLLNGTGTAGASTPLQYSQFATTVSYDPSHVTKTITVTNSITEISPTGVVLRVAPYALMLGVGLFLVLFMRRRKSQAEA